LLVLVVREEHLTRVQLAELMLGMVVEMAVMFQHILQPLMLLVEVALLGIQEMEVPLAKSMLTTQERVPVEAAAAAVPAVLLMLRVLAVA
jgi:hypothetical protein